VSQEDTTKIQVMCSMHAFIQLKTAAKEAKMNTQVASKQPKISKNSAPIATNIKRTGCRSYLCEGH